MSGEDFTVELQFSHTAGYSREGVVTLLSGLFQDISAEGDMRVYIYERDSKIRERYIFELTGVKRDTTPRPVISQDLLLNLEYLLARNAALSEDTEGE